MFSIHPILKRPQLSGNGNNKPVEKYIIRKSFDNEDEKIEKSILALTDKAIQTKLNNIDDECRKVRFIEYLRDIVKKHRTQNIYFYLSTIADSRKNLKKINISLAC